MTLTVLAWNSQGNRGEVMWTALTAAGGLLDAPDNDTLVFVSEAGTPPWITPGLESIYAGHQYGYQFGLNNPGAKWFNPAQPAGSLALGMRDWNGGKRKATNADALWVPWQRQVDAPPSLRCSVALYYFPSKQSKLTVELSAKSLVQNHYAGRPVLAAAVRGTSNAALLFTHLPAIQKVAGEALPELVKLAKNVVPEGSPMMVSGDLNINALVPGFAAEVTPKGFTPLLTGEPTQNSGGQLDWGISNEYLKVAAPSTVWRYNAWTGATPPPLGASDHSMIRYDIDI